MFYCHRRLLERSAKLAETLGHRRRATPTTRRSTDDWGVNNADDPTEARGRAKRARSTSARSTRQHAEKHDLKNFPGHKVAKVPNTGGSLTALPIIETLEGEVSAYIPTNVISITDGQIYLQPDLFFAGVRPAMDVGISVSRVGGNAQITAHEDKVAGGLRLDLAAFRELEAFAQLGTELDKATQPQLDRGYRMVEMLKQPQYKPLNVDRPGHDHLRRQAGGYLDKVDRKKVQAWEEQFLKFMQEQKPDVRDAARRRNGRLDGRRRSTS